VRKALASRLQQAKTELEQEAKEQLQAFWRPSPAQTRSPRKAEQTIQPPKDPEASREKEKKPALRERKLLMHRAVSITRRSRLAGDERQRAEMLCAAYNVQIAVGTRTLKSSWPRVTQQTIDRKQLLPT